MSTQSPTDDVIIDQSTGGVTDQAAAGSDATPASQNQGVQDEVDEAGISYKNRFFEAERKLENLTKSIPQMIQEAATAAAQQTGSQGRGSQQPEYTVNDYLAAKVRDPQNSAYYDSEILKLQEKKIADTVKTELTQFTRQQKEEQIRSQAEQWAVNTYPQLRDVNNPFTQEVLRQFNARSPEKREPQDFALAAELVANRMGIKPVTQVNPQQDKLIQKERELKKFQKERAIEGDGRGTNAGSTNTQKQADLKAALDSGNLTSYLQKYVIKPVQAE